MVIRPSNPEPSPRVNTPGTEATPAQPVLRRDVRSADLPASPPAGAGPDRAEVSSTARELLDRAGELAPGSETMPPERTRAVLARLRTGHYDRPEVLDQVAREMQAEIDGPGSDA